VFLPVGSMWRARVWVKTENLTAVGDAAAEGAISIRTPAGEIASSVGRSGTTPWRDEDATFRVPSSGHIDLTLVGVRSGTKRACLTRSGWNLDATATTPFLLLSVLSVRR
jgi:hypothetical protein